MFQSQVLRSGLKVRFPRIRGDVPRNRETTMGRVQFSPHTRGCSGCRLLAATEVAVFPAYAGMFLWLVVAKLPGGGFPRIRGDVPQVYVLQAKKPGFSPHTRGCSLASSPPFSYIPVFPAYAGMFRRLGAFLLSSSGFPRIRGDVPE